MAHELGLLNCELLVGLEADFVGLLHGLLADEGRHLLELAGDLPWGAWLAGAVDVTEGGGELHFGRWFELGLVGLVVDEGWDVLGREAWRS